MSYIHLAHKVATDCRGDLKMAIDKLQQSQDSKDKAEACLWIEQLLQSGIYFIPEGKSLLSNAQRKLNTEGFSFFRLWLSQFLKSKDQERLIEDHFRKVHIELTMLPLGSDLIVNIPPHESKDGRQKTIVFDENKHFIWALY